MNGMNGMGWMGGGMWLIWLLVISARNEPYPGMFGSL